MNAVVTLSIGTPNNERWIAAGLPSKQEYARRIGAEFLNITERQLGGSIASEKYQIQAFLDVWERVFYLDADSIIDPAAPNIFDLVPENCFGIYDESRSPAGVRLSLMQWLRDGWPDCPCDFYANNGVFVCSREHDWLFDHAGLNRKLNTYEQTHMVYRLWEALQHKKISVHWLSRSWNYMPRCWIGGPDPGWIAEQQPDPVYVWHFPCHRPAERAAAMENLNTRFGL